MVEPSFHATWTRNGLPSADDDFVSFGFDLPEERWLARLREAEHPVELGTLGNYEIIAEVGRGGQGVVYRARQPATKRDVALKRLVAGPLASPLTRARFEREVETAAALHHPNIVTVYGMDSIDGQPVLAMEWVEGLPIDRWAHHASRPRSIDDILGLFIKICDGLTHAHQRGVIHRDLKPSNILVDAQDEPHLLDFGLAKALNTDDADAAKLTMSSDFVGTPAYASPEQVRNAPSAVDVRSDVYALGVILYQLLTGVLPYGPTRSLNDLLNAIQQVEPARPSAHNRGLDRELDVLVLKALAKDQAERYQSVAALADDIRAYRAGEPISAHPPSALYQARKFVRRHWLPVSSAATVVALIVVFAVVVTLQAIDLKAQRDRAFEAETAQRVAREAAVAAEKEQRVARTTAERVSEFLQTMLSSAMPHVAQGRDMRVSELLDAAGGQIDSELADEPAVRGAIHFVLGSAYMSLAQLEPAEHHLAAALADRERVYGENSLERAETLGTLATLRREQGRFADAVALVQAELAIRESHPGAHAVEHADAWNLLAMLEHDLNAFDDADKHYQRAVAILDTVSPRPSEPYGRVLKNRALLAEARGDLPAAEALMERSVAVLAADHEPDHPTVYMAQLALGQLYRRLGRYDEALKLIMDNLPRQQRVQGADHPDTLATLSYLATLYGDLGSYSQATAIFERILETDRRRLGERHPDTLRAMNNLALAYAAEARYAEAETLLREALDRCVAVFGDEHSEVGYTLNSLAHVLQKQKRLAEAGELMQRGATIYEQQYGPDHPETLVVLGNLATLRHDQGDYAAAETAYRTVIERQSRTVGPTAMDTLITQYNYAGLLNDRGAPAAAESIVRAVISGLAEHLPADHWLFGAARGVLGDALLAQNRLDEAAAELTASREILLGTFPEDSERIRKADTRLARLKQVRSGATQPTGQ